MVGASLHPANLCLRAGVCCRLAVPLLRLPLSRRGGALAVLSVVSIYKKKKKKKESRLEHHIKNFLDAISCVIIALKKKRKKKKSKIHHNIHCLQ